MNNDMLLQAMIENTQYGSGTKERDWYSFKAQQKMAYTMARELVLDGMEIETAIVVAKEFHDTFYKQVIEYDSWVRS